MRTWPVNHSGGPSLDDREPLLLMSMAVTRSPCSGSNARAIDDEPVAHIALQHPLVRDVDLVAPDDLDVGDNSVFAAMVGHLLRFGHPADVGAGETLAPADDGARLDPGGRRGARPHAQRPPGAQAP